MRADLPATDRARIGHPDRRVFDAPPASGHGQVLHHGRPSGGSGGRACSAGAAPYGFDEARIRTVRSVVDRDAIRDQLR